MLRIKMIFWFLLGYSSLIFSMELPERDPYEILAELVRSTGDYRLIDYNCLSTLIGSESPLSYEDIIKFSEQQSANQEAIALPTSPAYNALEQVGGIFPESIQKIVNSLKNEQRREQLRLPPIQAVLLYGPSGVGKTTIARAMAEAAGRKFLEKSAAHFGNTYQQSKKIDVLKAFEEAKLHTTPLLFFIDEIDALTLARDAGNTITDTEQRAAIAAFWGQFDDCMLNYPNILIVVATNTVDKLDKAVLRRFGRNVIEVSLPNFERRKKVLTNIIKDYPIVFSERCIDLITSETEKYSVAHLREFIIAIIEAAYEQNQNSTNLVITEEHVHTALVKMKKVIACGENRASWNWQAIYNNTTTGIELLLRGYSIALARCQAKEPNSSFNYYLGLAAEWFPVVRQALPVAKQVLPCALRGVKVLMLSTGALVVALLTKEPQKVNLL